MAYLVEENRILRRQLGGQRLQLTDDDRRRLGVLGHQLGRRVLRQITTVVTPDTILRWHRQLVARKWTYARKRSSRHGVLAEIRRFVVRMAEENPTWGYTRMQGALKNVGHRVGRSTIARILKRNGLSPVPERPTSWQTFLRANWGAIAGADFFTTEVWTWRGLVTYYSVFVIDLASRRVQIVGSTPYPNEMFMCQVSRTLTVPDGPLGDRRILICDRDGKWSPDVRQLLADTGVQVVQTPFQAPKRTRTLNASCGRSNTSASIGSYRLVSATFDERSRNSSSTTTASGIIKGSGTGSSTIARCVDGREGSTGVSALAAC